MTDDAASLMMRVLEDSLLQNDTTTTNTTTTLAPTLSTEPEPKDALTIFSAVMTNVLLFFLIFGLSATVQVQNLKHQLTNKFAIATGVMMQFLIMPFLGFVAVVMLQNTGFTYAMGISLLVVTASPGGSYSNWWCSLFNAELALSVAMTSVSSILSIGLLPANLTLYSWLTYTVVAPPEDGGDDVNTLVGSLDFDAIFITLGVVLSAILIGLFFGYKFDNATFHARANSFGSFCGLALILFSVFLGSGGGGAETNFWSLNWSFYVGVAFPCVVGMTLANVVARSVKLSRPETVAISIECCYQNTAIATSLAATMFTDPNERAEAISVPLFYGFVEAFVIGVYCVWAWKVGWTKAPAKEKLCVVVTRTYEVEGYAAEHEDGNHNIIENDEAEADNASGCNSCWKGLFEPRFPAHHGAPEEKDDSKHAKDVLDPRQRFNSADVTIATSVATPPGTPEVAPQQLETVPQNKAMFGSDSPSTDFDDLEAPAIGTLRGRIDVVNEEGESIEIVGSSSSNTKEERETELPKNEDAKGEEHTRCRIQMDGSLNFPSDEIRDDENGTVTDEPDATSSPSSSEKDATS